MATKPATTIQYEFNNEPPKTLFEFKRGSNNNTRATFRLLQYPHTVVCMQLEDLESGGEMWFKKLSDLEEFVRRLGIVVALLRKERNTRY